MAVATARKRTYTIDAGTHSVLKDLDETGRAEFEAILEGFDRRQQGLLNGSKTGTIHGPIRAGAGTADKITLELDEKTKAKNRIIATVVFTGGVLWRRGSLRIPNVVLPKAVMISIKGRRIGDIVQGAPFPDFIIRGAVHDQSVNGNKLRIRCTGDEQVEIER